jgi:hypothetical protein
MRDFKIAVFFFLVLLIIPVYALPTTGAAIAVGNNNATFQATGVTGTVAWFMWGQYPGKLYLKTINASVTGGAAQKAVWDFPFMGSTTYYVKACDTTGCGSEVSFTTTAVTPLPTSTLGKPFTNMTETHFDLYFMPYNLAYPFTAPFQPDLEALGIGMLTGLLLFGIFFGMWFRGRNVAIPALTGFILAGLFMYSDTGFNLGIPPEYLAIAQGAFCACIAGMLMSLFKKG